MKTEVIHFRNNSGHNPKGGVTIAYHRNGGRIRFAVAACHPDENYNKKEGFALAKARLELSYTFPVSNKTVVEFRLLDEIEKVVRQDFKALLDSHASMTSGRSEAEHKANFDAIVIWQSTFLAITPSRELLERLILQTAGEVFQGKNPFLQ